MDAETLRQLTDWFRDYVDRFRDDEGSLHPMVELKLAHSARVALYCRTIAERSDFSPADAHLAEAGGWLHDVGRFTQWVEYGTYRDRDSVDHAQRGREVLEQETALERCSTDERTWLLRAVALHNRLELPEALSTPERQLCDVVRDADKLDIYDVIFGHLQAGELGRLVPALSSEAVVNGELLAEIGGKRRASYRNVRTQADFLLVSVAWAYELTFPASAALASQKDAIGRLAPHLPATPEVQTTVQAAAEHLRGEAGRR